MGLIESSPHYLEILQMMLDNVSGRKISKHLKDNYGEEINYGTINKYKRDNADIASLIKQVELQQKTVENGKIKIVEDTITENAQAQEMIISKINQGINVINFIREGLTIAESKKLFQKFFDDESIPLKEKVQVAIQLAKLDLDWLKSDEPNVEVNIDNNIGLSKLFDTNKIRERLNEKRNRGMS